eukprot:360753-Chlamydomonas_euryale.AAC.5
MAGVANSLAAEDEEIFSSRKASVTAAVEVGAANNTHRAFARASTAYAQPANIPAGIACPPTQLTMQTGFKSPKQSLPSPQLRRLFKVRTFKSAPVAWEHAALARADPNPLLSWLITSFWKRPTSGACTKNVSALPRSKSLALESRLCSPVSPLSVHRQPAKRARARWPGQIFVARAHEGGGRVARAALLRQCSALQRCGLILLTHEQGCKVASSPSCPPNCPTSPALAPRAARCTASGTSPLPPPPAPWHSLLSIQDHVDVGVGARSTLVRRVHHHAIRAPPVLRHLAHLELYLARALQPIVVQEAVPLLQRWVPHLHLLQVPVAAQRLGLRLFNKHVRELAHVDGLERERVLHAALKVVCARVQGFKRRVVLFAMPKGAADRVQAGRRGIQRVGQVEGKVDGGDDGGDGGDVGLVLWLGSNVSGRCWAL